MLLLIFVIYFVIAIVFLCSNLSIMIYLFSHAYLSDACVSVMHICLFNSLNCVFLRSSFVLYS